MMQEQKIPLREERAIWTAICEEAKQASQQQPELASFFHANILNHSLFSKSLSFFLANQLESRSVPAMMVNDVFEKAFASEPQLIQQMLNDLLAHYTRDAACDQYSMPLLYFKGFHAMQSYRIAHWLWRQQRQLLARYFQHRIAELFDVDIHPAAQVGSGIMLDHATGLVVGETAIIEDNVSMLHGITLGGSGVIHQKRHPKVSQGVLLSVGAKLLGNIVIGEGAKIGAGSLVLQDVPAYATVVGVPGRVIARNPVASMPSLDMNHVIE